jgi:hypothetical protein
MKTNKYERHGMSRHPAWGAWHNMIQRCGDPTHAAWKDYGGRGIKVCVRWQLFANFWKDMGPTYQPGLTLDRINNDRGYKLSNCRWATWEVQNRNKRMLRSKNEISPTAKFSTGEPI